MYLRSWLWCGTGRGGGRDGRMEGLHFMRPRKHLAEFFHPNHATEYIQHMRTCTYYVHLHIIQLKDWEERWANPQNNDHIGLL